MHLKFFHASLWIVKWTRVFFFFFYIFLIFFLGWYRFHVWLRSLRTTRTQFVSEWALPSSCCWALGGKSHQDCLWKVELLQRQTEMFSVLQRDMDALFVMLPFSKVFLAFEGASLGFSGRYHTLVLTDHMKVYSFGCNEHGQLGPREETHPCVPLPVQLPRGKSFC